MEVISSRADKDNCEKWISLRLNNVSIFNAPIEYKNDGLKCIFDNYKIPHNLDVLFLDIDGGEYQLLKGFINKESRPKIICVEYDNSFPLSIDYVPSKYCHQASSMSFYKLMSSLGYIYVNTFFHDHIFMCEKFADQINFSRPPFEFFCRNSMPELYQLESVLLHQKLESATAGIDFYEQKLNVLISEGHPHAADFFSYVMAGISTCLNISTRLGQDRDSYSVMLSESASRFIKKYVYLYAR